MSKTDKIVIIFRVIIKIVRSNGRRTPANGYDSLIIKPRNIRNAVLNPIERRSVSSLSLVLYFNSFREMNPGIKIR